MTDPGDDQGRRALAILADLARGTVRPVTRQQLDSGLEELCARVYRREHSRRSLVPGWTILPWVRLLVDLVRGETTISERQPGEWLYAGSAGVP